ncbi:MAG: hypothetical protein MJ182_05670 [Treponema sp.]|nr:hypothetical protein [Treponema sp.]
MTPEQYKVFSSFRNDFKEKIQEWSKFNNELMDLQAKAVPNGPDYEIQTPVCYNTTLDDITEQDEIKLLVIGDNPGKNEQLAKNRRYLVGLAGKLGEKFFVENPELNTDFRKNVIILNKTPIHSARTEQLRFLIKNGSPDIARIINESQIWMAEQTAQLHMKMQNSQLWLVGYAELKGKGLFLPYRDFLLETYKKSGKTDFFEDSVFIYQHFSMNRFTIDLNNYRKINNSTDQSKIAEDLKNLGSLHRKEIFGL